MRIGVPLAAALLLGGLMGENMTGFYEAIIWSLIAELIYYTIYPLLRPTFIHWTRNTLIFAYAAALAMIALYPGALNFHEFGPGLTWIVGLPSWLLGCKLAGSTSVDPSCRSTSPWLWRGAVRAASSAASMLRFHANIGYPATLTLFGVLVYFWIREEIRYYRYASPPAFAEFFGRWSYSVYLVHGLAAPGFARLAAGMNPLPLWVLQTLAVYIASYGFFLSVEMPSHRAARYLAKAVNTPAV